MAVSGQSQPESSGPDFPRAAPEPLEPGTPPARDLLFWASCLALALACRLMTLPPVLLQGDVRLIGTDAYHHLRRIQLTVLHFPNLPDFDPYLSFPSGARSPYEPGFDLLLAGFARGASSVLGLESPSQSQLAALCAVAIPFLGLLVIPLYARMALHLAGPRAMRATALFLALLPGVTFTGLLGQVDHHLLEPLVLGLPLLIWMERSGSRSGIATALLAGTTLGLSLFFWRGVLLAGAILGLGLGLRALWLAWQGIADRQVSLEAPLLFGTAALVAAPIGLLGPSGDSLTYFTISALQPVGLGLMGCSLWLVGRLCLEGVVREQVERSRKEAAEAVKYPAGQESPAMPRSSRGLLLVFLALAGLQPTLLTSLAWPELGENLASGLGFLGRTDPFVLSVSEQRPLFLDDDGHFSLRYPLFFYGPWFLLLPFLVWMAWQAGGGARAIRRGPGLHPDLPWLLFGVLSVVTLGLALTQRRYAAHFGPVYAVWIGLGFTQLRVRARGHPPLARGLLGSLLLLSFFPTAVQTAALAVTPTQPEALLLAMRWLRSHTPPTSSYLPEPGRRATVPPEYGVLAAWDEGHHVIALGERPSIANPLGVAWFFDGVQRVARFWLSPASQVVEELDALGARFALVSFRLGLLRDDAVVLGLDPDRYARWERSGWEPGPDFQRLGSARLTFHDGLTETDADQDDVGEPLPGIRLVWEGGALEPGAPAVRWLGDGAPAYKLFERVHGARLRIEGTPGERVLLEQDIRTTTGRRLTWRLQRWLDGRGTATVQLPYANVGMPPGWSGGVGLLRIRSDRAANPESAVQLEIPDAWVVSGAPLRVRLEPDH